MKRFTFLVATVLVSVLTLSPPALADGTEHQFSALFIFGDSLSDPGNRFADTGQTAHPPFQPIPSEAYGVGGHHFSNGQTWVEVLAKEMDLINGAKPAMRNSNFGNYAYGGARARDFADGKPDFPQQVQMFLNARGPTIPSDALYVIQFGGNDLRDALNVALTGQDPVPILTAALTSVDLNIGLLAQRGATHFLIANAPNLGAVPATQPLPPEIRAQVTGLSYFFNLQLASVLSGLEALGLTFYTVNFFEFTTGVTMFPEAFGFTSIEPCLTFGVTEEAFCENRNEHVFWDAIHPTKAAHRLIGEIALNALPD